jgi:hypothetical protein
MNKELKARLIEFLTRISDPTYQADDGDLGEAERLLVLLQRKRGRIKGSKHPKKKAILSSVADELCYTDGSLPHLSTP